ncbi:MAG TPA: hypothetical protein VKD47_09785 [Miltoncostaeaceae bacterium]|nr:hypothetical protein [Miltoncostaeaceae bacterium]
MAEPRPAADPGPDPGLASQRVPAAARSREARLAARRRLALALWVIAILAYAGLGVAYPPLFLLGFQESIIFVFGVTWLIPWIVRRLT